MKVLVLMGSARKGDCYKIAQMVESKMKEMGDVDFEYLFLSNSFSKMCTGCHNCINYGEDACPHKTERKAIEGRIGEADGIIIASPVYCQDISGLLKNYFDHMAFMWHRPRYFGKKVMAISSGGGQFKGVFNNIEQNVKAWGCDYVCSLGVPHLESLTPKYRQKTVNDINKKAYTFFNEVKEKRIVKPSIGRLLWFNMWKGNAVACKESIPHDMTYWKSKGWIEEDYYYKTDISFINKAVIVIFGKIGKFVMHRVYEGY